MAGTLIVSLDFELFWGMIDCSTLEKYSDNVLGGRTAIPEMLELFERHGIHATWATVGFMFARDYDELKGYFPEQQLRPSYSNKKISPYLYIERIGIDEKSAPCFYGESLIKKIASFPGQEIGSHTFSHYYCKEDGQTREQFQADIRSALAIAKDHGYTLKSLVMPRNQCTEEYIKCAADVGFTAYRDEENDWIHEKVKLRALMRLMRLADVYFPITGQGGYIPKEENGLINLVGSRMYKPYFKPLGFMEGLKVRRIKRQMLNAAQKGLVFHLWWHPHNIGKMTEYHLKQLEEIFSYYDYLKEKYNMESLNMAEAMEKFGQDAACAETGRGTE